MAALGVKCVVVAPTLVPVKAGDRVKTDRRDAEKLACFFRAGDLTSVWVPDRDHEALRDLVRAREAAKRDQRRARNRLSKVLLRQGLLPANATKTWGIHHLRWVKSLTFERRSHQIVFEDYLAELEQPAARIERLESCIDEAIADLPLELRTVIADL